MGRDSQTEETWNQAGCRPLIHATVQTPIGWCAVASRGQGLWRSCLPRDTETAALAELSLPEVSQSQDDALLEQACAWLVSYFRGDETEFYTPGLDLADLTPFARSVLLQCRRIPRGQCVSYGELAVQVGIPAAARAVGQVMRRNPFAPFVPCHRVVGADGSLTGFGAGLPLKAWMLELEGLTVSLSSRGTARIRGTTAAQDRATPSREAACRPC